MAKEVTLLATGDVAPRRERPETMFDGVRVALGDGDIVFGQLECTISARGSRAANAKLAMRAEPRVVPAIAGAGFHVMSFAGNHCLDWGREAFFDTIEQVERAGVRLCGAGADLERARRPVLVEAGGLRVAFLAYSSILPQGYRAETDRPGCTPMRGLTLFEQIETDQPGTPARMHTFPHRGDLAALRRDVRAAKREAHFVAVSIHWGVHFVHGEIADYQRDIAYAAVDEGCDAVLGHHPHILKGIEIYKGRPIFYSLGNFAIEQPQVWDPEILNSASFRDIAALNPGIDPARAFVGPPDGQKSMIARLTLTPEGLGEIAYLPVQIGDGSEPETLAASDSRFAAIHAYVDQISREQGLATRFTQSGDKVIVSASPHPEVSP